MNGVGANVALRPAMCVDRCARSTVAGSVHRWTICDSIVARKAYQFIGQQRQLALLYGRQLSSFWHRAPVAIAVLSDAICVMGTLCASLSVYTLDSRMEKDTAPSTPSTFLKKELAAIESAGRLQIDNVECHRHDRLSFGMSYSQAVAR